MIALSKIGVCSKGDAPAPKIAVEIEEACAQRNHRLQFSLSLAILHGITTGIS